jgi:hypothetical protein
MPVWVCKAGGSLEEVRKELATIIGEENILRMDRRSYTAGAMNSYEITEEGWNILTTGFVGPQGFDRCPGN